MPVLLGYDGRDAEAEVLAVNDELEDKETLVEDAAIKEAADEDDDVVELVTVDVAGFFAQSQPVN